ncbi:hypothetical protein [Rufibacter roseolus]|uniref:hypothetical protein n=1 Tax=Rufibacter roseolus TaxID=2817375 RepID=UPI001B30B4C3|nr:hypothetical protein [Rufibacter roseolus]
MEKDITLAEDYYAFQRKEWLVARIFWIAMSLVLAAAALGLFGKGFLSDRTVTSHRVRFEFNKFMRVEKGTELRIHVTPGGQNAQVSFNNDYINKVRIDQIIPEPISVEVKDHRLVYTFSLVQNGFITFFLVPYKTGSQPLDVNVGNARMAVNQFVYF